MSKSAAAAQKSIVNDDSGDLEYRATISRVLHYVYPQSFFLFLSIVGFAIYAITQPLAAVLIEWLIKTLDGEMPNGEVLVPAAFIVVAIVRGIGTYMGGYYIAKVSQRMIEAIRCDLFKNILHLPLKLFDQHQSGKLVSLFTYNSTLMANTAARSITVIAQEGLTVIALLAYLFYSNWQFTSLFILLAPPLAFIINWAGKKIKALGKGMQESMASLNGAVSESFSGVRLIKATSGEANSQSSFEEIAANTRKLALRIAKINSIYTPSMQIMVACAMALVVVLVIQNQGDMKSAELIAYVTAAAMLSKPMRILSNVHVKLTQANVAAAEIFSYMDLEKERNSGTVEAKNLQGDTGFKDVSFRYTSDTENIIDNLNFSVKAGETVALVGRSGGGKSTIANLIPRFYDVENGSISIDGININDYSLSSLRKNIAIVSQQIVLFNMSVSDNIAYGSANKTYNDIEHAAIQANAHEFIEQLPNRYDTIIGEDGVLLSGGQRQRLAIARAILSKAPILILDEATSALDNESEAKVQNALDNMMGHCTTIVIAHRLSTIEKANKIIVLENGRIIESGTHDDLAQRGGNYTKMLAKDFT